MKRFFRLLTLGAALLLPAAPALAQFDHLHKAFDALLKKHVVVLQRGQASQARYAGFKQDEALLKAYNDTLSQVSQTQFNGWSKPQQMAFLINAYNALTVQIILTKYPEVKTIRNVVGIFSNTWKHPFFTLLGQASYLDQIEHDILRQKGVYDEPRIHYAVNCAAIGCPALREEAFTADRLDAQLEEQAVRFLSDRSRNRYNAQNAVLEVSKIFDWYKEDWQSGYRGIGHATPIASLADYFARYAKLLSDKPDEQQRIAEGRVPIRFLDYDWNLNDVRR